MKTIHRAVVNSMDAIRLIEVEAPAPNARDVLVKPTLVGICGSDVHAAHGRHPFIPLPYEPGHEVVGVIVEVGAEVDSSRIGKRVVIDPGGHCGMCEQCIAGRTNICRSLDVFGCLSPGAMTDLFVIPEERAIDVPLGLADEMAVLTEPLSTPLHAVQRAGDLTGKRVLVVGGGPIGLFLMIAARRAGAAAVVVHDLLASKRERASRLGATAAVNPIAEGAVDDTLEALGGQAHVVFDAVANESSTRTAIRSLLVRGGRLMVVGVPAGPILVDLELVQDNEIEIVGNLMFTRSDFRGALELLDAQPFDSKELVSHVVPFDSVENAFHASSDPESMKVLVSFSG